MPYCVLKKDLSAFYMLCVTRFPSVAVWEEVRYSLMAAGKSVMPKRTMKVITLEGVGVG